MRRKSWKKAVITAIFAAFALSASALALNQPYWDNVKTQEDIESIYQFNLEGKQYALPCEIADLRKDGWEFAQTADMTAKIPGESIQGAYFIKDGNKEKAIILNLLNAGGDAKEAPACRGTGIDIRASSAAAVDFSTIDGISLQSSRADVEKVYGASDNLMYDFSKQIPEQGVSIPAIFSEAANSDELYVGLSTGDAISVIEMNYYKVFDTDETPVSTERPAYLDTYTAPASVDADWTKGQFQLDGKTYQLPAPVSEFLDDGWTFEEEGNLPGLRTQQIEYLTKGDRRMMVYLANADEHMVELKNTYVQKVDVKAEGGAQLLLPANTSLTSKIADLEKAFPNFTKITTEKSSSSEYGTYEENGQSFYKSHAADNSYDVYKLSAENDVEYEYSYQTDKGDTCYEVAISCGDWNP